MNAPARASNTSPAGVLVLLLLLAGAVHAQETVHRCTDAAGRTAYQKDPCDAGTRQSELRLRAPPPVGPAPTPSAWKGYVAPRLAAITFYYDAKDEPVGFTTAQMESAIRDAAAAWTTGCQVELRYAGRAPRPARSSAEHVSIHWAPEYMHLAHPADGRSGIAGTGSLTSGIALRPRFREENMRPVLVHEIGHVLGLPHNHVDTQSIMSYLQDEASRRKAQPAASDLLACNLSMKRMFGIDFTPPADASPTPEGPRMTDKEALERKRGRGS